MQSEKRKEGGTRRAVLLASLIPLLVSLTACGFALRGARVDSFPAGITELRVAVQGSRAAHDPLRTAMRIALREQAGVTVVESGDALLLTLTEENFENLVLSVNAAGAAREYLLRYEVTYRVTDAGGKERVARDTVRVLREQLVEPTAVLARENEERELRETMRAEAAQQIVRRLARALVTAKP
jgi:LPS-assembly lipoprotein